MKINIKLYVSDQLIKEDTIEVEDYKMEPLSDEEKENALEINVRNWADRNIQIAWEIDPPNEN